MKLSTIITDREQAVSLLETLATIATQYNARDILFGQIGQKSISDILSILIANPAAPVGDWVKSIAVMTNEGIHTVEMALTIEMITNVWREYVENELPEITPAEHPMTPSETTSPEDKEMEQDIQMNRLAIGHIVSDYLHANNVTITALAEAAGVSREQIGWIITGKRDPRINTILRVMAAIGYGLLFEREK